MEKLTVLLTGAGAPGAPGIIECLRKNGECEIFIVGVDANENAGGRGLVDKFYTVPKAADEGFIPAVLEICKKEGVQVVVPIVTRELMKFAKSVPLFEECGVKVAVMSERALKITNNKASLLCEMKKAGFDTPEFIRATTADEVSCAVFALGYPEKAVCVKGVNGNGSRGVRLIDAKKSHYDLFFNEKPSSLYISFDELMRTLREKPEIPEMLVMEALSGQEYGVDMLCKNGEILYCAGRYNFDVKSSIPQGCILENREEPIAIASRVASKFCLDGHVNFDFMYDGDGRPRLIEINPRLSATVVSYAPAGINFPYLMIKSLLGQPLPKCTLQSGTKMTRRYIESFTAPDGTPITW